MTDAPPAIDLATRQCAESEITVIIPAYGPSPYLRQVLKALQQQRHQPQAIIVSHSASDDPTAWIRAEFPHVICLHSPERLFAGAARNRAAAAAHTPILAFCDCDVIPDVSWLSNGLQAFSNDQEIFVVGSVGVERTGGYWGMSTWLFEFSEQAPWRARGEQSGGASCNMILRKCDFDAVGGFAEHCRAGEDTVLLGMLRRRGLAQTLVPSAIARHVNREGFSNFAQHLYHYGKIFIPVRREFGLPGARALAWGLPALGLWLLKISRVARRLFDARSNGEAVRLWRYVPGVVLGALIWNAGVIVSIFHERERDSY